MMTAPVTTKPRSRQDDIAAITKMRADLKQLLAEYGREQLDEDEANYMGIRYGWARSDRAEDLSDIVQALCAADDELATVENAMRRMV